MTAYDDAVKAAAEALAGALEVSRIRVTPLAAAAVAAAAPILLAAERQRIAAGIEALPYPDTLEGRFIVDWQEGFDYAQAAAARIAESAP